MASPRNYENFNFRHFEFKLICQAAIWELEGVELPLESFTIDRSHLQTEDGWNRTIWIKTSDRLFVIDRYLFEVLREKYEEIIRRAAQEAARAAVKSVFETRTGQALAQDCN